MYPTARLRRGLTALAAAACLTPAALADTAFGVVVDNNNAPVNGAQVFFSGISNPFLTNASGLFSAVVAAGTYDVRILPGGSLVPIEIVGVQVIVSKDMGTISLKLGHAVTGHVVDPANAALPGATVEVLDEGSRTDLFIPNDTTDASGNFSFLAPSGTFRVRVFPPANSTLVPVEFRGVTVAAAPLSLGTIALVPGFLLTGTVVDDVTRAPVAGVDIDVADQQGRRIQTPSGTTDAAGNFSTLVPAGVLRVRVSPARGSTYVGIEIASVTVTGALNLGTLALQTGIVVTGTVRGPGQTPVVDADVDVDTTLGGLRVFTPHDNTDANGQFRVVVPAGDYMFAVQPAKQTLLVAHRTGNVQVRAATALPVIDLVAGVVLSGVLSGFDGKPEVDADIDIVDPTTGVELETAEDETDSLGRYSVIVPTGTWNVRFQTSKTSLSRLETVPNVVVTGNQTLDRRLTLVPVACYLGTAGVPTIQNGGSLPVLLAFMNPTPVQQTSVASLVVIDPTSSESAVIGPLGLSIPANFVFATVLTVPIAPVSSTLLGLPFRLELRFDETTGQEQDHSRFLFFIK